MVGTEGEMNPVAITIVNRRKKLVELGDRTGLWLLSHITIVEIMLSSEGEMNPVAMTIVNRRKKLAELGDRTSYLIYSRTLPNELLRLVDVFDNHGNPLNPAQVQ